MRTKFISFLFLSSIFVLMNGCYRNIQTHGKGIDIEGTVVDKHQHGHYYALFGAIDITQKDDIDKIVKKHPDCVVTTSKSFGIWLLYTVILSNIIDERLITVEFPVPKDSKRGKEIVVEQERLRKQKEAKKAMIMKKKR